MKRLSTMAALLFAQGAAAHFVWIGSSTKDGKVVVTSGLGEAGAYDQRFADRIKQTKYWVEDAKGKTAALAMTLDASAGEYRGEVSGTSPRVILATCDYGVFQREGAPASRLVYAAKRIVAANTGWKDAAPRQELPIELLAEFGDGSVVLRAVHHGKPLANAEIKTFAPGDDHGTIETDAKGVAHWTLKAPGEYACYVGATTNQAGEVDGKKYAAVREYATLTFARANAKGVASAFPPLPEAFSSFGAATSDGYVYVYGGHIVDTHEYSTASVHGKFRRLSLDHPDRGWEELPEGPPAQGVAIVAHRGIVYRIGGMQPINAPGEPTNNISLASCAAYDPATGKWTELPALPAARSSFDAVIVDGRIYLFGGWTMGGKGKPNTWCDHGLVLDLGKPGDGWKPAPQPFKRRALNAAAANGKVYVVSGLTPDGDTDSSVDVFEVATATWSKTASLPGGKRNAFSPAVCAMDGAVFASPADGIVYRLDERSRAWTETGKLQVKRIVHRMVPASGGNLLVLGGASPEGNVASVEAIKAAR